MRMPYSKFSYVSLTTYIYYQNQRKYFYKALTKTLKHLKYFQKYTNTYLRLAPCEIYYQVPTSSRIFKSWYLRT